MCVKNRRCSQKAGSLGNGLMLASQVKTNTEKNRSGEDVKEVEFYEASGSKAITKLIFLTFLPRFPWKLPFPAGVSGKAPGEARPSCH